MQQVSTFYPTFLGNFCKIDKLSVLKQQHVDLQNKHGKGYSLTFLLKIKMQNVILNNRKQLLTK